MDLIFKKAEKSAKFKAGKAPVKTMKAWMASWEWENARLQRGEKVSCYDIWLCGFCPIWPRSQGVNRKTKKHLSSTYFYTLSRFNLVMPDHLDQLCPPSSFSQLKLFPASSFISELSCIVPVRPPESDFRRWDGRPFCSAEQSYEWASTAPLRSYWCGVIVFFWAL